MTRRGMLSCAVGSVFLVCSFQDLYASGGLVVANKEDLRPPADVVARGLPIPGRYKPSWEDRFLSGKFSAHELSLSDQGSLSVLFMDYGKEIAQQLVTMDGNNALHMWLLLKIKKQQDQKSVSNGFLRSCEKFAVFYTEKMLEAKNSEGKKPFDLFQVFHSHKHKLCGCSMWTCFERWFKKHGLLEWTKEEQTPDKFDKTSWGRIQSSLKDRCMVKGRRSSLEDELAHELTEKRMELLRPNLLPKDASLVNKKIKQLESSLNDLKEGRVSLRQWFLKQRVVNSVHVQEDGSIGSPQQAS